MGREVRADKSPSTPVPPRQDQDLRNRLLEAGQRVFAETGYAGTRVDDIIEAANTSRATFYRYFKSKNALFTELSRICFVDMRVTTRAIASVTPGKEARGQLIELLKHWRDLLDSHGGVIRAWFERDAVPDSTISGEATKAFDALFEELLTPIRGGQDRLAGPPGGASRTAVHPDRPVLQLRHARGSPRSTRTAWPLPWPP